MELKDSYMNHKITLLTRFISLMGSSAEAARKLGVSSNTISSWTTGKHDMRQIYFDHLRNKYDETISKHTTPRNSRRKRS
jgi:uncharacterized protein YjcR